ncbi:MAG: hypothetical protein U0L09_06255 [Christensenellales bacterium]|nr:hypothetical protein [Christensenellales bacterium]
MRKKHSFVKDFTTLSMLFIPIGVAVNFVGAQLTTLLKLPIFLDCIGTLLTAMLAGPWIGAITGVLTNIVNSVTNPAGLWFSVVNAAIGLTAGFLSRANMWRGKRGVFSCLLVSLLSVVTIVPILFFVFGGLTAHSNSIFIAMAVSFGMSMFHANLFVQFITQFIDKPLSVIITRLIICVIPPRTLITFSLGKFFIRKPKSVTNLTAEDVPDAFEAYLRNSASTSAE